MANEPGQGIPSFAKNVSKSQEVSMLKFKFNYLQNTLAYQKNSLWYQIAEEKQFQGDFDSQGFKLNAGWISFTLYENKIRAFYKQIDNPAWFTYYRKDLPKECPVIFEFTEQDQVEKINGKWTKKGGKHE
jgi:hypothetical protein